MKLRNILSVLPVVALTLGFPITPDRKPGISLGPDVAAALESIRANLQNMGLGPFDSEELCKGFRGKHGNEVICQNGDQTTMNIETNGGNLQITFSARHDVSACLYAERESLAQAAITVEENSVSLLDPEGDHLGISRRKIKRYDPGEATEFCKWVASRAASVLESLNRIKNYK